ncbi:phage baseplate assembly protein [Methylobacterium sp. D48H]
MPSPDLICEVRTESGTYRDWLTVSVSQSFDAAWQRTFRLTCAEPSRSLVQRLLPGARVDIALAGQVVIQEGYIGHRQAAYDANRHGVQVDGFSKAEITRRASADAGTGQFRGYKVDAIANRLLKPHGLKFRVENGPDGWDTPFPNVIIRHGETPFDAISRLCNQRGLWLRADANGDFVGGAKQGGATAMFEEGLNILSANCSIAMPSVQDIVARSQQPGSDSLFGRKAAEISAKAQMSDGIPGLSRKVLAEMPLSQKELQLRTNMEAQALEADLLRVTLVYQGWLNPNGELWSLSDFVTVKSPMLFPTADGLMNLKLWGYTYTQTPEGQTTTAIELVNAKAFQQKNPDGQASDGFYNRPVTPAQPEAST